MRSISSVEQPIEQLFKLSYSSMYPIALLLVVTLELRLHHPPPLLLVTAHPQLHLAQGRASTTPTSWRAHQCNVRVKWTRPNAVDRLG